MGRLGEWCWATEDGLGHVPGSASLSQVGHEHVGQEPRTESRKVELKGLKIGASGQVASMSASVRST